MASIPTTRPGAVTLPGLPGATADAAALERFAQIFGAGLGLSVTTGGENPGGETAVVSDGGLQEAEQPSDDALARLAALLASLGQPIQAAPAAVQTTSENATVRAKAAGAGPIVSTTTDAAATIATITSATTTNPTLALSGASLSAAKAKAALVAARLPAGEAEPDPDVARALANITAAVEAAIAGVEESSDATPAIASTSSTSVRLSEMAARLMRGSAVTEQVGTALVPQLATSPVPVAPSAVVASPVTAQQIIAEVAPQDVRTAPRQLVQRALAAIGGAQSQQDIVSAPVAVAGTEAVAPRDEAADQKPATLDPALTNVNPPEIGLNAADATMNTDPTSQPAAVQDPAAVTMARTTAAATPMPMPSPTDSIAERQLDLASSNEWLDRLASDIARSAGDEGQMRFRLNPSTLGHMTVELRQTDRGTAIHIAAETEAARVIIAEAQPRLVAEARAQGVRVADTQVSLSHHGGGEAAGQQQQQQRQAQAGTPQPIIRTAGQAANSSIQQDQPRSPRSGRYA
mgnify:CR=1 FL=1